MLKNTLYILYNADASVMGKLKYGYRKITCPKDAESPCAACDITHGGLSLKETPAWEEAKAEIRRSSDLELVQWHRDEISPTLKEYVKTKGVRYPAVVLARGEQDFQVIMDAKALAGCNGDPKILVKELRTQNLLKDSQPSAISSTL